MMKQIRNQLGKRLVCTTGLACLSLLVDACAENQGGIELVDSGNQMGSGGRPDSAVVDAADPEASSDVVDAARATVDTGTVADAGSDGARETGAGPEAGGSPDAAGETAAEAGALVECAFSSGPVVDPPRPTDAGGAPDTGDAAAPFDITIQENAFIGRYLADRFGRTLYLYGADFAGDCEVAPTSNCVDDCAVSWPPFNAGERSLDPELDPADFGTIERGDGTHQTTYRGWPLYFYKKDEAGSVGGQGKGKIWFSAELTLPNLIVLRAPAEAGGTKYLGDDRGRTLYAFADDGLGTADTSPVSVCEGVCTEAFRPFSSHSIFPVTALEPADVSGFIRSDGVWQIAYKGAPLYYSTKDTRSGDLLGVDGDRWSLVEP
jgi:predicted lipoprotein with Yx(FWY)xxD motif